jgi:NADH-quinone oxidoreductase subunit A
MDQYLPILFMLVLAGLFAGISFFASRMLAPQRPTPAKSAPYECGIIPEREPSDRFPVRFYLVAMIFIIIDIEVIFVYPWAVIYRQLGAFGLWEMVLFSVAVFASFVYLIGNGALDWGPVKKLRPVGGLPEPVRSPNRTAATTVRRVDVPSRPSHEPAA